MTPLKWKSGKETLLTKAIKLRDDGKATKSLTKRAIGRTNSTGASDRSFYPIFNKSFAHLETLLTICRPKKVWSAGPLCGHLEPSPPSKCPKRTFMLPQQYHVSVSNMLSKPLKCFMENEN